MANSKFRNDLNVRYTKALFFELTTTENREAAIYTLSKEDKHFGDRFYRSLYQCYMNENDILEHDFANKYFEDWEHWQNIARTNWMKPLIAKWRVELETRIKSDALKIIRAEADAGTKYSYAAAVYLAKKGWEEKIPEKSLGPKKSVGRPSKAQIAEEAHRIAIEGHSVDEDLARLGVKVN